MKKFKSDKLREECGVFGISNHDEAATLVALGLHALQHRGQEGCGIVSFDGKTFHSEKRQGLVGDHFTKGDAIKKLPGYFAIGHTRYSTTGETSLRNIQPFYADLFGGGISIAHNGNLTNAITLRKKLVKEGAIFRTTSDTETVVQLIAKSKREKIVDKIIEKGHRFAFEWSEKSKLWKYREAKEIFEKFEKLHDVIITGCREGLKAQNGKPLWKNWKVKTDVKAIIGGLTEGPS